MGAPFRSMTPRDERPISSCFFCGERAPAEGTCPKCLVTMPRITCACGAVAAPQRAACARCGASLADDPRTLDCPRCHTPTLAVGIDATSTVHACVTCHGLFVPPRAWCALCERPDLADVVHAKLGGAEAPPSALVAMLKCPVCEKQMDRGRFAAGSDVVVDVCLAHGLWFDGSELGGVAHFASRRAAVGPERAHQEVVASHSDPAREVRIANAQLASHVEAAAARARLMRWYHYGDGYDSGPFSLIFRRRRRHPLSMKGYLVLFVLGALSFGWSSIMAMDCGGHAASNPTVEVKGAASAAETAGEQLAPP